MKLQIRKNNIPKIITVIVNILLFIAVIFLMNFVQTMLKSDSKITLTEVVTQNKDVITSKLNLELNNVENYAKSISLHLEDKEVSEAAVYTAMKEVVSNEEERNVFVSLTDGTAIFLENESIKITGRNYFKLSMQGIPNISDKLLSRTNGEEVFIISVPMYREKELIGSVQRFYSLQEMYKLCSLSLFSSKGTMHITNKDGYIMISSQSNEYNTEKDNLFRLLYGQGNETQSKKLEENIKNNKNGFMEITLNDSDSFMSYTPIEGIHDWYLVTSVSKEAVSPNGNIIIRMFYVILVAIVIVFGASMLYFFYFKKKQQDNIERLAFIDPITNGTSYAKFVVDFQDIMIGNPKDIFYLLKFDIDNFKYINNYYSFAYGDKLLLCIYQNIHAKLLNDERISRISSDHFIVLLKNDASEERLHTLLNDIECEGDFQFYFSAGLYEIKQRDENLALMVDRAGAAARASKGNLVKKVEVYSEEFDQKMIHNEQLKRAVKQAIDDHEIIPFYQPKVDVNTNKIVGAEALARWRKSDGTWVFPDEFISICEQSGLIIDLDMSIFEDVLKFQRSRLDALQPCVTISVNFSRNHLFDQEFLPKLTNLMLEYNVPMELIEIEITESAFFDNMDSMKLFVSELHKKGFIVSMDDFGSGYSSLNMLKDVEIDVLKFDRNFLMGTENSEKQRIIFAAISRMAKELSIKVVVEGVETEENIQMMKAYGCSIAQGYYYAKPMPMDDFVKTIKEESL